VNYRKLGKTDIVVSEIGFGAWGIGGNSYGPVNDRESVAALECARENGVTFYDTADLYGEGHSEELIGETFRSVREHVVIATKVGTLPHSGFFMPQDFSDAHILTAVEESLRRLGTDYIDLYQLHSPPGELLSRGKGVLETMEKLKLEGKIREFGISVRSPADGVVAIRDLDVGVIQVNFNLIDQRALESGLFDLARERGVGVIVRTPLCFGYLTGSLNGNETFSGGDHRKNWPADQLKRWASAADLFSFLNDGKQMTPAQLALRYCLDYEQVSTVIPGMLNTVQVRENVAAASISPLDYAEIEQIRLIYSSNTFYDPNSKKL